MGKRIRKKLRSWAIAMGKRIRKKQRSWIVDDLRIRKKQRSSSSIVVDLNYDVVSEILLNLPVKSLLRFRSVCKAWCSIIDSSAFRKSRRKNNNNNDDMLFLQFIRVKEDTTAYWELKSMDRSWKFPPSFHKVLNLYTWNKLGVHGPINGVICMYDASPMEDSAHIVLCNPVCPRETKILPLSPILGACLGSGLILDGQYSRIIGFGFDSDYKVVQIIGSMIGVFYVEVYSARTETWRQLDPFKYDGYERYFGSITTLNYYERLFSSMGSGAIAYWMLSGDDDDEVIVSFDLHNEVFGIIRLPEEYYAGMCFGAKDEEDDSLVLIDYKSHFSTTWEVRELEIARKERGWAHLMNVDHLQLDGFEIAALWKYGLVFKTTVSELVSNCQEAQLLFYDYRLKRVKKCVEFPICDYFSQFLEYKVTLNSLDMCLN